MPTEPLLIFDGNCGFCRIWIEYWKALTGGRLAFAPSQEVGSLYAQIPSKDFSESVQLVTPGGEVFRGAQAVFMTLTYAPGMSGLLWLYNRLPGFAPATEAAYRLIAGHRTFLYHLTRLTFGKRVMPLKFAQAEWLFLRCLAAIYLIAFWSLAGQIAGLIGAQGILPLGGYLAAVAKTLGARGYWSMPTIFWLAHGDWFLKAACIAGIALAALLLPGILSGAWERLLLAGLYVLYLSLSTAGQDFLSFQWDSLLLETGFLAIFLGNSKIVVLLFRWLLFRLMFLSGGVKLTSHDPVWRDWSALAFHYMTQPLPTPLAWYMYQLPLAFQRFSTAFTLSVELAIPFLFFAPRPWRFFAAGVALFLQVLIFLTGNYTFFNLLAMSLCVLLFDDRALRRFHLRARQSRTKMAAVTVVALLIMALSVSELQQMFFEAPFDSGNVLVRFAAPFQIANTYGLFASMTVTRPEIIVEGSNDGVTWLDYEFPYKTGDLRQPPHWVAPYQPRLDWQMWFAALGNYRENPWFVNFAVKLLEGSPEVRGLLEADPFQGRAPRYVRAELYDYTFTDAEERRRTGNWWKREVKGLYLPPVGLKANE